MGAPASLALLGTSHERAGIAARERLAVSDEQLVDVLAELAAGESEAVVLSTCNRTEIYLATPGGDHSCDGEAAVARARRLLVRRSELSDGELAGLIHWTAGPAVAAHLFRVAAGLDSLVPGEAEILGQVRRAHAAARAAGAAGPLLDRLFRHAVRAGRRARSETAVGESPASIPSVAGVLAERVAGDLARSRILVVGAGTTAELVCANLASRGAVAITIANRSEQAARELAGRIGGQAVPLSALEAELERCDVVVSATSASGRVLEHELVERAIRARRGRPLLLLDLAVPRDIAPSVARLSGCVLYDLDALAGVVGETLAQRRREAARAGEVVAEEARRFGEWWTSLEVVPAISSLRERAEQIRRSELDRWAGRLGELTPRERRSVEFLTSQIVNKLLHLPTVRLKESGADGLAHAQAVRHLFGLDEKRP